MIKIKIIVYRINSIYRNTYRCTIMLLLINLVRSLKSFCQSLTNDQFKRPLIHNLNYF